MLQRIAVGLVAAALALVPASGAGVRAQDKSDVIKQRQALMKQQAADLKVIQNYVVGDTDRSTAIAKVTEMMTLPPQIVDLFPPGTSLADFPGQTHAKAEIWQQWERFQEVPPTLRRAEAHLADVIKNGSKQDVLDALDAVGRMGCGACHTYFRAPLDD